MPSAPEHRLRLGLAVTLFALLPGHAVGAQVPATGEPPFAADIQAFSAWDAKNATPVNPIVFAGSSSIRLWNTHERFPSLPVVNRGFGGSQLSDVNTYLNETVLRYKPRTVVLYAGDNDINAGKSNEQVFADYQAFVRAVHAADASVDIIFVSIKPSVQRWALWPRMRALNERVRSHAATHARLHYVDLATPMLGRDGQPRAELFVADGLHMTAAGYDIWSSGLKTLLDSMSANSRR